LALIQNASIKGSIHRYFFVCSRRSKNCFRSRTHCDNSSASSGPNSQPYAVGKTGGDNTKLPNYHAFQGLEVGRVSRCSSSGNR